MSSRGDGTPKLEERNAANEIKTRGREGGDMKSGRNRYDSKGFKGNLMPIRKEIYTGPRGDWQGSVSQKSSMVSGIREGEGGTGYSRYGSKGFKGNLMAIRRQVDPTPSTRVNK